MVATVDKLLGVGLYTPAEAALYARVPVQVVSRWLFGSRAGASVLRPQLADDQERFVTFLDFVQSLAIRTIRTQYHVPLRKIREAVEKAEEHYGLPYPFAREHRTFLYGNELLIKLDSEELVQVSGKHAHHRMLKQIVELYMRDLSYHEDGLARAYRAYLWGTQGITMDPQRRFGEPIVDSCGYTARALWEACEAEGSIEAAAKAYGVRPEEVEAAYRYHDYLQGRTGRGEDQTSL